MLGVIITSTLKNAQWILRPNKSELIFLTFAYNRFYDIYEEVIDDTFVKKDDWHRLSKIKDGFAVYTELLNYEPLKWTINKIKELRPPMEGEIASELLIITRHNYTPILLNDFLTEQ